MKFIIVRVGYHSALIAQLQEVGLEPSKLTAPNPTTNALKTQEPYTMVFIPTARKTLSFLGCKDVST